MPDRRAEAYRQDSGPHGSAPRVATMASDELTGKRVATTVRADGFEVVFEGHEVGDFVEGPHANVLVGVFGRGLTERDRQIRALARLLPLAVIVAVIPADSRRGVRRALEVGARGVVFEAELEAVLSPTLSAVLAGQIAIPSAGRDQVERPALSFREKEILGLMVVGMSNKEISAKLFLAESTVKCHLSSAFGKLGVRSRNEAADLILNEGAELGLAALAAGPSGAGVA